MKLSEIVELKKTIWMKAPNLVQKLIRKDMIAGKVQGKQRKYKSKSYKKYKANNMRRFTDGKRLKSYVGVSIRSANIGDVNMYLTGQTIDGLHTHSIQKDGATLSYASKDANKVLGNENLGSDIRTLNDKNQKTVQSWLEKEHDKLIKNFYKTPIEINISIGK